MHESDILVDCLTFTLATGQEESRRDGLETIEAHPRTQAPPPDGADHARPVEHLLRAEPGRAAGPELGVPARVRAGRAGLGDRARVQDPADVEDPRRAAAGRPGPDLRPPPAGPTARTPTTRCSASCSCSRGCRPSPPPASRAEELAALPLDERLQRRIIDGERNGLEADLDEALTSRPALEIINETLLSGMKTVGELFGSGQMQLPFVLQSAEVMKAAVAYLEPHMEKADSAGKGTIVLATVKGDVHDIGKNLVDIILSNNGYTVVNIGIKQPIGAILEAAEEHEADVIGMSGLLVKSTVIMKENLQEMNSRGIAERYPVLLGGAALTRGYVEQDLAEIFDGDVRYARDAFEGLRLMDALMADRRGVATGVDGPDDTKLSDEEARKLAERKARRERSLRIAEPRRAAEEAEHDRGRRPLGRRHRQPGARRRRSGATGSSRASRWPTTPRCSTSGRRSWASGACAARAAATGRRTRSWSRPTAGRGCGTGWTASRPRASSRPPSSTATTRA